MNINVNALKEAFYKQLYNDYKSFLNTKIETNSSNAFSKTLKKYNGFKINKDGYGNLGEIKNGYKTRDIRICASIEDFFNIIKTDSNALDYVSSLMQYIKNATTKVEGSWLMVEDTINKLILKHFWEQRCKDGSMSEDDNLTYNTRDEKIGKEIINRISFKDFCVHPEKVKEYSIIELIGNLPPSGLNDTERHNYKNHDKEFLTKHLDASRTIRNNFGHKKFLLPENFADAIILARFKLYSYLAATLCLGTNNPQIDTQLIIEDRSESHNAQFNVFEVNNNKVIGDALVSKQTPLGYEFTLKRCHTYFVKVSGISGIEQKLNLHWFSLSPIGTWDGIKLTLYDNDFEKVAHDPSGTLSSVLDMNNEISETLNRIDKTLSEGTKEQKRQMNQVLEELKNLQQSICKSTQARFDALLEANKEQIVKLDKINLSLGQMVATMAALIGENNSSNQEIVTALKKIAEELAKNREEATLLINYILEEQEQKRKKIEEQEQRFSVMRYLLSGFPLIASSLWLSYNLFDKNQNLSYLENKLWYWIVFAIPLICLLLLSIAHHNYSILSKNKMKIIDGLIIVVSLMLAIGAFMINQGTEQFINSYDYLQHDSIYNKRAASLLEQYIAKNSNDEVPRIKLSEYYLSVDDENNALRIASQMADVKKYKKGCEIAAETFYRNASRDSTFYKVWDIIDDYKLNYKSIPLSLQFLEGIMYFKHEGVRSQIEMGSKILEKLANEGYPRAQYWLGYYLCNGRVNKKNPNSIEEFSTYNLSAAVDYLRRASSEMAEASLELGRLYADLTVEDSAMKYLDKIITNSYKGIPDSLISDAYLQKALFYLTTDGNYPLGKKYLDKAASTNYYKALYQEAQRDSEPNRAIEKYQEAYRIGKYDGNRYINPIVFEYIALGDDKKALSYLTTHKPECNFGLNFIEGIKYFMRASKKGRTDLEVLSDSTMAMEYMKKSAQEEGCTYAKMICAYYYAKSDILNGIAPSSKINELHKIGATIPFAFFLEAKLLSKMDTGYSRIEETIYRYLEEKNQLGANLLASLPSGYPRYLKELTDPNKKHHNSGKLGQIHGLSQGCLRLSNRAFKKYIINIAYQLDRMGDEIVANINPFDINNKYHNIEKLHFWSDVAIGNHAYYLECHLIPIAHYYKDKKLTRRLIESALYDFPSTPLIYNEKEKKLSKVGGSKFGIYCRTLLSDAIKKMPKEYVDSLKQIYHYDYKKQFLFFSKDFNETIPEELSLKFDKTHIFLPIFGGDITSGIFCFEDSGINLLTEYKDLDKYVVNFSNINFEEIFNYQKW